MSDYENYLKSQKEKIKEIGIEAFQRVDKSATQIQKVIQQSKNPIQQNAIGPARPPVGAEYSESSSSEDEDDDVLKNDPIFKQAMMQKSLKQQQVGGNTNQRQQISNGKSDKEEEIKSKSQNSDSDDDDSDNEEINQRDMISKSQQMHKDITNLQDLFPISLEATLKGHQKKVTTLTIDQSGSRLASGANDYFLRLWDFNGMNQDMNSFRVLEPLEGHPIKALSFNSNSQNLLVVGGGPQICLVSRDGRKGNVSIKGDMYITDMAKTKGHVSSVNSGVFHPLEFNIFATGSLDATVRIWDSEKKLHGIEQQMTHVNIIKCTDQKGTKTEVDKIQYSKDGKIIMIGTQDGSLQGYSTQICHRPAFCMRGAHAAKNEYGGIHFFKDNFKLVTRNCDGTLKLWDLRNFKKPINYVDNLPSYSPGPSVCLSPDEKYILTGSSTSNHIKERDSFLYLYDSTTLDEVAKIKVGEDSITDMIWHPQLNQIIFGVGENIQIYFDQQKSKKGALNCISKKSRQVSIEDLHNNKPVISPHALPLFKESYSYNPQKQLKKIRTNPIVSHKPEQPQLGHSKGGQINNQSTITQFLMNTLNSAPSNREDAQQALLKMQEQADKNPMFITNAYKETQPEAVLDVEDRVKELEEQKFLQKIKEICPSCGLKICTCKNRYKFEYK
ncbi:WD domain, G-beta repeat protein (macronuclear) [Tetrahymena thermophila SB210]|uniref:WD domain, G-beta repeat protein n=1 Tax=Tetrahymena thermophila (strain SB210) TaxID=312017 RepID=I7M9V6_TETTS|nr:WD domain, G-beta repeat protein [Tetrahymena thermophila SB210]EAS02900.1 WD domain, G-beta repeat protein [Tetrahymena thermophila SB210]|eukprot:XP_001023145.1 WD domain, G-beta repeat protein [Tetrahymena thermophila SB210]